MFLTKVLPSFAKGSLDLSLLGIKRRPVGSKGGLGPWVFASLDSISQSLFGSFFLKLIFYKWNPLRSRPPKGGLKGLDLRSYIFFFGASLESRTLEWDLRSKT